MTGLERIWYGKSAWIWPLLPFGWLYCTVAGARRLAYRTGLRKIHRLDVPVIVVGNLTVGGTGKTPLVTWLVECLRAHGYRPGLVARGYGGRARHWPQPVRPDSDPAAVGDEPVLLARATGCPMAVAPDRVAAARALLAHSVCDVIVSDDGLQHYALGRDVEIAVIDGVRRFGNGRCLPAGPLREPARRLAAADLLVSNGPARPGEFAMWVRAVDARNLVTGERRPLTAFRGVALHAVAGIGRPERFFDALHEQGLEFEAHAFPDHHAFREDELGFPGSVLMTEKDAVKCESFARPEFWAVGARTELDPAFGARLLELLRHAERGTESRRFLD